MSAPLVPTVTPRSPLADPFTPGRAVMLADPLAPAEQWATRTSTIIGAVAALWVIARFVIRPLWDDLILAAWRRKGPEAEKYMRDEMFKADIAQRSQQEQQLQQALTVANQNAQSIAHLVADMAKLGAEQRAMTTLLGGIPLLAAGIETVNDTLEHMRRGLEANTEVISDHGEKLAAISALIMPESAGRRHSVRRANDQPLTDDSSEDDR